jgi:site-specific DNA recombinase
MKLHQDWIRRFLRNPFYYGHFEYAGERYEGKHEPIISKELFDRVQKVLERKTHHFKTERQSKPLAGLFRCAECGMMVTAEVQKGHTYYRCTKKAKGVKCSQPFVRAENLASQLEASLAAFALRADWADEMLRLVDTEEREHAHSADAERHKKQAQMSAIAAKLQKLLEAYLEELIDRDAYAEQKRKLMEEKKTLQEQFESLEGGNFKTWLEPFRKWILTAKTLSEIAYTGSLQEKKVLAQEVFGSNLFLDRKKALCSPAKPWSLLIENDFAGGMVGWQGLEPWTNALKGHCSTN